MVNWLTDRKINLKCHMMDRLYHDAFGDEEAKNQIASANYDYIIVIEKMGHAKFFSPFLYYKGNSLVQEYIEDNYKPVKEIDDGKAFGKALIYKKVNQIS